MECVGDTTTMDIVDYDKCVAKVVKKLEAMWFDEPAGYSWESAVARLRSRKEAHTQLWAQPEGHDEDDPELALYIGPYPSTPDNEDSK